MAVERVTPDRAAKLLQEGWTYLDVRSVPEFQAGHPEGAFNAPLLHRGPQGMAPNPEFLAVVSRRFPKETCLVIGCRSGGQSLRAAKLLADAGYRNLVDMQGGYAGEHDGGGLVCEGWESRGLPTASNAAAGRSWDELSQFE